jgi:hypothetical protein
MLDFYLQNTPLHAALLDEAPTTDWQIRVTVNGQSFNVDQWLPVYLKGLNVGLNWVKLEFLDSQGHLVPNQFNSTAHLINYQPNGTDTLSRLVRGEAIAGIEGIINPNYKQTELPPELPKAKSPAPKELKISAPIPLVTPEVSKVPDVKEPQTELPIPDRAVENELDPNPKNQIKIQEKNQILDQPLKKIEKKIEKSPSIQAPVEMPVKEIEKASKVPIPMTKTEAKSPLKSEIKSEINPINPDDLKSEAIAPHNHSDLKDLIPDLKPTLKDANEDEIDVNPKVLKGLDNLNLAERLKQSRQKKAQEESLNYSTPSPKSSELMENKS